MSLRSDDWSAFAYKVWHHINLYTVPQYGDKGEDQVTKYTAAECINQAQKYLSRFGRASRKGEEHLDLMKAAHYIQMAHDKLKEEKDEEKNSNVQGTASD